MKGAVQLKEIEQRLQTFDKFFDGLKDRYDIQPGVISTKEIAPLLALAAIPAVVGALADVAALFHVDRAIKGHTTSVSDEALMAQVTSAIKAASKTVEIYRPSLNTTPAPAILTQIKDVRTKADSATLKMMKIRDILAMNGVKIDGDNAKIAALQKKLDKVNEDFAAEQKDIKEEIKRLKGLYEIVTPDKTAERTRLADAVTEQKKELAALEAKKAAALTPISDKIVQLNDGLDGPKNQKAIGELAVTQYEVVIKAFNDFANKLVSVPDGGTSSPLANLAETCILRDLDAGNLILTVAVAGQGGEVETRKSIWTSGTIYHRAGTACTYTLFAKDGKIADAGLVVSNRQAKEGKRINPKP